ESGPREQPLALPPVFDHDELRAHGAGVGAALLDRDIADDAAGARTRLLRIDARARQSSHPGLEQSPVVVDQRDRVVRIALLGLARHPVPAVGSEQRQPVVERGLVEQPRLVQQESLAVLLVERRCIAARGPRTARRCRALPASRALRLELAWVFPEAAV